jgi:hypothetical protein
MGDEKTVCVVCAWRQDCQKKFLRSQDLSSRCPEFTKDLSIKVGVRTDDTKENSGDNT